MTSELVKTIGLDKILTLSCYHSHFTSECEVYQPGYEASVTGCKCSILQLIFTHVNPIHLRGLPLQNSRGHEHGISELQIILTIQIRAI